MPSKAKAIATTDHDEIRRWAEERGATPACVRGTGNRGDIGMLRLDFPGYTGAASLEPITWEQWFEKFDERGLALLHQETTAQGQKSNFNKLISRETVQARKAGPQKVSAMPQRMTKASSTEKSAAQHKAQSRNVRRSSEGKSAQKHKPITNVSRKQESAKPSPRPGGGRRAA